MLGRLGQANRGAASGLRCDAFESVFAGSSNTGAIEIAAAANSRALRTLGIWKNAASSRQSSCGRDRQRKRRTSNDPGRAIGIWSRAPWDVTAAIDDPAGKGASSRFSYEPSANLAVGGDGGAARLHWLHLFRHGSGLRQYGR